MSQTACLLHNTIGVDWLLEIKRHVFAYLDLRVRIGRISIAIVIRIFRIGRLKTVDYQEGTRAESRWQN